MKTTKTNLLLSLAALGVMLASCSKDDFTAQKNGVVEFSFQSPAPNEGGRVDSATPANVILTIEDHLGNEVYTLEEMPLVSFSGTYLTNPITLAPGSYVLTEFLVTDDSDVTVYASPKSGSATSHLVTSTLNINFTVSADQITTLVPEVVSTEFLTPEDFGYASFGLSIVETFDFLISAQRFNIGTLSWVLTDATVSIEGDGTGLYSDNIASETAQITILDGYTNYQVTVSKTGYTTVVQTYTQAEMEAFFDDPLVVQLSAE